MILPLVTCSLTVYSQAYELVYFKSFPFVSDLIEKHADDSGFEMKGEWMTMPTSADVGIWGNHEIPFPNDNSMLCASLVYDENFEFQQAIHYNRIPVTTGKNHSGRLLLNFNATLNSTSTLHLTTSPPINDYPTTEFGRHVFINYNPTTEIMTGLLDVSANNFQPSDPPEPFEGYLAATAADNDIRNRKLATVVQDSLLIAYIRLYDEQTVNGTMDFSPSGGQIDLLRLEVNLNTMETSAQQIGSTTGSHQILRVFSPSPSSSKVYRMGIVRGENTPVSISGAEPDMVQGDSLYHVYITRETASGQTEWLTELYAYNNALPDTFPNAPMFSTPRITNSIFSAVERENSLYVSSSLLMHSHMDDTLYYHNFLGEIQPHVSTTPSTLYSGWDWFKIGYSESRIHRLDFEGNILCKLSAKKDFNAYLTYTHGQYNRLFDMGEHMVWFQAYRAASDTVMEYVYTDADGNEEYTYVELPPGTGIVLVWLNDELVIESHAVMPYESTLGMRINGILPYRGDTIAVYGALTPNTTVDLNIFDPTSSVFHTTDDYGGFLAFYSGSGPVAAPVEEFVPEIKIHPNPAKDHISVRGRHPHRTAYTIHDLTGRLVQGGNLDANGDIRISELNAGMYVLSINLETGRVTRKFSVL